MELEFDKEIDAILRKARDGGVVAVTTAPPHLDADTVAAFAENALPQPARLLSIAHFADCHRCRKILSQALVMNSDDGVTTAAGSILLDEKGVAAPWYEGWFKTQNLALAMGALVVVFSGVLGYIFLQNRDAASNTTVSQITEQETQRGGPSDVTDTLISNSNASTSPANSAAPFGATANSSANTATPSSNNTANRPASAAAKEVLKENPATNGAASGFSLDGADANKMNTSEAPPPPPSVTDMTTADKDEKKMDAVLPRGESQNSELSSRRQIEQRRSRDMPPAAAKAGPSRAGPVQSQTNQQNTNIFEMAVKRVVRGKTFENRDRAWYDTAYRGQPTAEYRRGTDGYKKLDSGLRTITDTLGGTVVVVWKDKAYRIQ